ncbi:MAG: winged helix-turn-helix domain-containing protein [Candidatus Thermoplasmatota archaeon]
MFSRREILMFKFLPGTVSDMADRLNVYPGTVSKITERMMKNGLARKQREGKKVFIYKEQTGHSQELEEIIDFFPRLPIEEILSYSNLKLISWLGYPLDLDELCQIVDVSRQWIYKKIRELGSYGIITKEKKGFAINPYHRKIQDFAKKYYDYKNHRKVKSIAEDASIIWQHGNEFLFKTKKDIESYQGTAVVVFSKYNLPMTGDYKYYYNTERKLETADFILHTVLINPLSKTYNGFACLLYEKTKPSDLVKKARIYGLVEHVEKMISFIKNEGSEKNFLPSWDEYESLAKQYGVR